MNSCGFDTFVNLCTFFFFLLVKTKQHQIWAQSLPGYAIYGETIDDSKKSLNYLRQELLLYKYPYELNANESSENLFRSTSYKFLKPTVR